MPRYEVIDVTSRARFSHTRAGEVMGTTLFESVEEAMKWATEHGLTKREFLIREVNAKTDT